MSRAAGVCIQYLLGTSYMRTIGLMLMISPRRKWFKHHLCTLIYLITAPHFLQQTRGKWCHQMTYGLFAPDDDKVMALLNVGCSLNPMWGYRLKNKQLCLSLVLQWQPQIKGEMNNQRQEGLLRQPVPEPAFQSVQKHLETYNVLFIIELPYQYFSSICCI